MTMNDDIKKFGVHGLTKSGVFVKLDEIKSTRDYNHFTHQIHHYIPQQEYERNKQWFDERGIKQKLFLLPTFLHEQVHLQAIHNLPDAEFEKKYHISRWELVFNRKYSNY